MTQRKTNALILRISLLAMAVVLAYSAIDYSDLRGASSWNILVLNKNKHVQLDDATKYLNGNLDQTRTKVCVKMKRPNVRMLSFFVSSTVSEMGANFEFVLSNNLKREYRGRERAYKRSGMNVDSGVSHESCTEDMPVINLYIAERASIDYQPHVVNVVVGDEHCYCLGPRKNKKGCNQSDLRQYLKKDMLPAWLPLGPRYEFKTVQFSEISASSERSIPFNFFGTVASNRVRGKLRDIVSRPEWILKYPFFNDGKTTFSSQWQGMATSGKYLSPVEYRSILLKSMFTLCPEGANAESYRIYEAIESGSIPVLVHSKRKECQDPYTELMKDNAPILMLDSWEEFPEKISYFLQNPAELDALQESLMKWRERFWKRIIQTVQVAIESKYPTAFQNIQKRQMVPEIMKQQASGVATFIKPEKNNVKRVCVSMLNPNVNVLSFFVSNIHAEMGAKFEFVLQDNLIQQYRDRERDYKRNHMNVTSGISTARCTDDMPVVNIYYAEGNRHYKENAVNIIVQDEQCECYHEFANQLGCQKADLRQYWNSPMNTKWLPLGPRYEFEPVTPAEIVPSSERTIPFNFLGALSTNRAVRGYLKQVVLNQELIQAFPFLRDGMTLFSSLWKRIATTGQYLAPREYRDVLLKSMFTLCPEGSNAESFRIYEAIESGSIPVLVHSAKTTCNDPYKELLEDGAPMTILDSWDDFPERIHYLIQHPEEMDLIQTSLKEWRNRFWKRVTSRVEKVLESTYPGIFNNDQQVESNKSILLLEPDTNNLLNLEATPISQHDDSARIPLITGCGRSGTLTLKNALQNLGVSAVHEGVAPGAVSVSWLYAAYDAHKFPFEKSRHASYRKSREAKVTAGSIFGPVIHLVRHPLKVISSTRRCFCGKGTPSSRKSAISSFKSWGFASKYFPSIDPFSEEFDIARSARYWLYWNLLVEKNFPQNTLMLLESWTSEQLLNSLGLHKPNLPQPKAMSVNGHTSPNTVKENVPDVTWKVLNVTDEKLARSVFELAQKYGYEIGETFENAILK